MATVEILGVQQPPRMPDILQDHYLDRPAVQQHSQIDMLRVIGWAIGATSRVVAAEIAYRNRIIGVAPVDIRRADVEASHPALGETPCGFVRLIDVSDLAPEFELTLRVVLEDGSRVAFGSLRGRHGEQPAGDTQPDLAAEQERIAMSDAQDRLDAEIERLIEAGLAQHDQPQPADTSFLERLDLRGRRVLVVGSGLGELARAARAQGAGMVDVIEPDSHLAKVERVITAHRDVSREFFFDHDPASPESYASGYGVALAPVGIDRLEPVLPDLAKHARVLVTALPFSRGKPVVSEALRSAFPEHALLGEGRAANGRRSGGKSGLVVLATGREDLDAILGRAEAVGAVPTA